MQIKVEVLPWLSNYLRPGSTGRVRFEHQPAGTTLRELLNELAEGDPAFAKLIYDREAGALRYPVVVAINDQLLEFLKGLDTVLSEGDTVTFMAAYTGG